jgi:hypothetical protein
LAGSYLYLTKIVSFSPWNALTQEAIIGQFFETVSSTFTDEKFVKYLEKFGIGKFIDLGLDVAAGCGVPAATVIKEAFHGIKGLFNSYKKAACVSGQVSLIDKKNKLAEKISKFKIHYVVFIDDLDRLNKDEVKLVIQLVKSVCNIPNFIFVMSFDEDVVADALKNEQNCDGKEYLDKIVQLRYDLPDVGNNQIRNILIDKINKMFGRYLTKEDVKRFNSALSYGLFGKIDTLRKAYRFLNFVSLSIDDLVKEINIVDLISIEYISMFYEGSIGCLDAYSHYLFGVYSGYGESSNEKPTFEKALANIGDDDLRYLVYFLFPRAFQESGTFDKSEALAEKKICLRQQFDLYRSGSLGNDRIPREVFFEAMKGASVDSIEKFANGLQKNQLNSFFDYCECLVPESKNIDELAAVTNYLLNSFGKMPLADAPLGERNEAFSNLFLHSILMKYQREVALPWLLDKLSTGTNLLSLGSFGFAMSKESSDYSMFLNSEYTQEDKDSLSKAAALSCLNILKSKSYTWRAGNGIWLSGKYYPEETKKALSDFNDDSLLVLLVGTMYKGWVSFGEGTSTIYTYPLSDINSFFPMPRTIEAAKRYLMNNAISKENVVFVRNLIAFLIQPTSRSAADSCTISYIAENGEKAGLINGDVELLLDSERE